MRDVTIIMKSRNKLKEAIDEIAKRMREIENGKSYSELNNDERKLTGELYGLFYHYKDQMTALNYVLNEDNKLDDYRWNPTCAKFEDLLIKFD